MNLTLSNELRSAVANGPTRVIDAASQTPYVLLSLADFERLTADYDTSPWTDEEMDLLAAESVDSLEWPDDAGVE